MPNYTRTRTFTSNTQPVGGGIGPAIDANVLNEYEAAHQTTSDQLDTLAARVPVAGVYALKRPEDPRAFGLTGGVDDSAALQACFNAAGAGGSVELPKLTINYRNPLVVPSGMELRGTGPKGSVLQTDLDIVGLSTVGGEGHAFKNFKLANTVSGTRTTYDIDIVNPFKPVLEHVEIALGQASKMRGGIRIWKDAAQAGASNCFMPVLNDVWIRNGVLRIADVTDVKVTGGWVWGTFTDAPGAVELSAASNCSFHDLDIVPSINAGYLVSGGLSNLSITGGLMDGSYDTTQTGWGFKTTDYVRGLVVSGVKFWNIYLGGMNLYNVRRASITGCTFSQNNRGNLGSPDIQVASSTALAVVGNNFGAPATRTTRGRIYTEDSSSSDNIIGYNVLEYDSTITPNGHNYDPALFTVRPSTTVKDNRPDGSWPTTSLLSVAANYQVTKEDLFNRRTVFATGTTTVTMPSAGSVHGGDGLTIKNRGTGTVTVATTSSQLIEGVATLALTAGQSATVQSDGAGWYITARA